MHTSFGLLVSPVRRLVWPALLLAGVATAQAAAPTIRVLTVKSALLSESIAIHVEVTDADSNLNRVEFYVQKVGEANETLFSTVGTPGASAVVDHTHAPTSLGYYKIRVVAVDTANESATLSRTTEIFTQRVTVAPTTFAAGPVQTISANGEILTTENTAATNVDVPAGAAVVLQAKSRVRLLPGFRARSGADFTAYVDANMNGFSDLEEIADSDGDGMPDVWEYYRGLDVAVNDAAADPDGDGLTNLQEYLQNRNPHVADNPANNNLGLKLFTPGY